MASFALPKTSTSRIGNVSVHRKLSTQARARSIRVVAAGEGLRPELRSAIDKFVKENKVVLFMKGTKEEPRCGFSNTCVQIFNSMAVPFESVNILEDEALRSGMKEYSAWPTFPQVYIDGEFFGGCDITVAAFQDGTLKEAVEKALAN